MSKKPIQLSDYQSSEGQPVDKPQKPLWPNKIAKTVSSLPPSGIREFFDIVAARDDCISLGVGEPDFVSPNKVIQEAVSSLRNGYTHYTGNQGYLSFREAIAAYLENEYELSYDPSTELLITVGVSQGLDIAIRAISNPGDRIMYAQPSYVSYGPMIELAGAIPVPMPTTFDNSFEVTADLLEKAYEPGTKALLLNYPCNPTGATFTAETLEAIARFAIKNDILVISDEIYAELTYDGTHMPISKINGMKDRTLLLGGFSKSFAMTGWRIAYMGGPAEWVSAALKIHQYSMLCAPAISQIAAETALKHCIEDRDRMFEAYRKRRDLIVAGLNEIGLTCHTPGGAFYVFPQIGKTGLTSLDFAKRLLDEQSVAVVPGPAFGPQGEGFIRLSYATSVGDIEEALARMKRFVDKVS